MVISVFSQNLIRGTSVFIHLATRFTVFEEKTARNGVKNQKNGIQISNQRSFQSNSRKACSFLMINFDNSVLDRTSTAAKAKLKIRANDNAVAVFPLIRKQASRIAIYPPIFSIPDNTSAKLQMIRVLAKMIAPIAERKRMDLGDERLNP